jgi:predicted SAM-dependent methyltransferase
MINIVARIKNKIIKRRKLAQETPGPSSKRLALNHTKYPILKLHIGCGPRVLKGWVNIDLGYEPPERYLESFGDAFYPAHIRGNSDDLYAIDITRTGLPLPDNSVDVIFHEDFMEHINQRDQIVFLAETLRVLKKDGIHRINTPNLLASMEEYSDFSKGIKGVHVYEWDKWHHFNIMTPTILQEMATLVGYSKVIFTDKDASTSPHIPKEYRPSSRTGSDGNLFADLIK